MKAKKARKNKKVIVAMSGGVDSSVSAFLLKNQGYLVEGAFIRLWPLIEAEKRAEKIARALQIPFYVFNFEKDFKKKVVDYFLAGYKKGITPNPCVVCNREIKFGLFLKKALAMRADYVATGHYAKKINDTKNKKIKLLRAKDKNKDQSYFLWTLNQKQLEKTLFPVANYKRAEVESLAKKNRLPLFGAKKSQEVCFILKTTESFLKDKLKTKQGNIVDKKNNILGKHQGLHFYTIGQRKGIKLTGGPYYVLKKDLKNNALIVTKNKKDLIKRELILKNINWVSGKEPSLPLKVSVKIRYCQKPVPAVIIKNLKRKYKLIFSNPKEAVASGQSAVFYNGQEVLGGGVIV